MKASKNYGQEVMFFCYLLSVFLGNSRWSMGNVPCIEKILLLWQHDTMEEKKF